MLHDDKDFERLQMVTDTGPKGQILLGAGDGRA
jgi:hypothetical protein